MRVTFLGIGICALASGLACPSGTARKGVGQTTQDAGDVVLFFTGSELGALKPCGCSGGQLGGLEKRTSIFSSVPKANRLIIDTGALVESDREQDLIKFRIIFEAFTLLDYDLAHLTAQDVEIAEKLNVLSDKGRSFDIIGAESQNEAVPHASGSRFRAKVRKVSVDVAAFDPEKDAMGKTADPFPDPGAAPSVSILILRNCGAGVAQEIAATVPTADCIICPSDSDEPQVLSDPGARPLIFTVGRLGRHICRLDVVVTGRREALTLRFEVIRVEEKLPSDQALVQLYGQYQQLVRESKLLEKHPRIPLPDDLTFVGSKTCNRCHEHEYEYDEWRTKAHADAFATLKRADSDYDPECVVCHVVGMEYATGFVSEETTPDLKDVGCENCHGPGSEHTRTLGQAETPQPQMTCLNCHTPEHSSGYAGHEEEFMRKIVHWREP